MRASIFAIIPCLVASSSWAQLSPAPRTASAAPGAASVDTSLGDDLAAYERAMATLDYEAAADVVDRLIDSRRPADTVLRTDPLLNALVGRLQFARGGTQTPRAHLDAATPAALPSALRSRTAFALAGVQERMGDRRAAEATLTGLAPATLDADERRDRIRALARLALVDAPARVGGLLQPAPGDAVPPRHRWEDELVAGTARALLGDLPGARAAADRAWAAAVHAPANRHAPQRVALLRAALADDRDTRLAMLEAAGAANRMVNSGLASLLPLCGAAIRADDFVTFAVHASFDDTTSYAPVRASRVSIVPAFHEALANRALFAREGALAGGSLVTLRCRTNVAQDYDVAPPPTRPWDVWMIERGLYAPASQDEGPDEITAISTRLIEAEKRHGMDSPRLLPLIEALGTRLMARSLVETDVEPVRVAELRTRFVRIMRAAGAPPGFVPTQAELAVMREVEKGGDPLLARAATRGLAADTIASASTIVAYSRAMQWFAQDAELPSTEKRRVIDSLLARFADAPADLRRRALLLRLADLDMDEDRRPAAMRSLRAAGVSPGSCMSADEPATILEQNFSTEDYPVDLVRGGHAGHTTYELTVGADGRSADERFLLSTPADLFDDIVRAKLRATRFTPARRGGRATSCMGFASRVRWVLPTIEADEPPGMFVNDGVVTGS